MYLLFSVGKAVRPTEQLDDRSVEATARGTNHLSSRRSSLAEISYRDRRKLRTFGDCIAGTNATNCLTGYGVFFNKENDTEGGQTRLFKIMNEGKAEGKEHSVWTMWMELIDGSKKQEEEDAIPVNVKGVQPPWLYRLASDMRMYFQVNMSAAGLVETDETEIETGAGLVELTRGGNLLVGLDGDDEEKNKFIRITCYYNGVGTWFTDTQTEYKEWYADLPADQAEKGTTLPKCGQEPGEDKAPEKKRADNFEERVATSIKGEEGDGNKEVNSGGGDTGDNSGPKDTDKKVDKEVKDLEKKGTKEEKKTT